jgi:hypothetical protein
MRILVIFCGLLLIACSEQHSTQPIKKNSTVIDSQIHAYQKAQAVEQVLLEKEQADQEQLEKILQ